MIILKLKIPIKLGKCDYVPVIRTLSNTIVTNKLWLVVTKNIKIKFLEWVKQDCAQCYVCNVVFTDPYSSGQRVEK